MGPVDSVSVLALPDWAVAADIVAGVAAYIVVGVAAYIVADVAGVAAVGVPVVGSIVIHRFYLQLNSYYA